MLPCLPPCTLHLQRCLALLRLYCPACLCTLHLPAFACLFALCFRSAGLHSCCPACLSALCICSTALSSCAHVLMLPCLPLCMHHVRLLFNKAKVGKEYVAEVRAGRRGPIESCTPFCVTYIDLVTLLHRREGGHFITQAACRLLNKEKQALTSVLSGVSLRSPHAGSWPWHPCPVPVGKYRGGLST